MKIEVGKLYGTKGGDIAYVANKIKNTDPYLYRVILIPRKGNNWALTGYTSEGLYYHGTQRHMHDIHEELDTHFEPAPDDNEYTKTLKMLGNLHISDTSCVAALAVPQIAKLIGMPPPKTRITATDWHIGWFIGCVAGLTWMISIQYVVDALDWVYHVIF